MMRCFILTGLFFIAVFSTKAAVVYDTLYINKGFFETVDTTYFAYYAFNDTATFSQHNSRIVINPGDSVYFTVINTDTAIHGFNISHTTGYDVLIPAGDTATVPCLFNETAVHIFYDHHSYPDYRYMGLGGMLIVDNFSGTPFYWNVREHEDDWNDSIDAGHTVNWQDYQPNYFTVNALSNPFINEDTTARVTGSVGDTIRIYIANTGQAIHSIHFHGYHAVIIYSGKYSHHAGRSKDTFGVHSMETLILELVPDKAGEFPVHDHNLTALSGGNVYPHGMFMTILIE